MSADSAVPSPAPSHDRGRTDTPLIEHTIGDFFDLMSSASPRRSPWSAATRDCA